MRFEDAVYLGLGLKVEDYHDVPVGRKMWCSDCGSKFEVKTWQDEGSCPRCYSSNVYVSTEKELDGETLGDA